MWWIINIRDTKKFRLQDDIMVAAMESDGYAKGEPGAPDKNPTSLDQILAVSAFISVWIALGLWQDLSLSSRVIIPGGLSLALTSDFHINMYNIIGIIEVTCTKIVYYKFLPLYLFHQDGSCW